MATFPVTDENGHTYADAKELSEAVEWLERDAGYLRRQASLYRDPAVKERVMQNAERSNQYALRLRRLGQLSRIP